MAPTQNPSKENMCTNNWDPVCGVNEKTYSNECYAKIAGVTVAYKGECELIVPPLVEKTDYTTLWLTGLLVLLLILVVAGLILVKNKNKLKFG
ncbi:MAG TPA: Kazal-type serine protease inhibitor [archaeon]|nr:Kazal-type serine protease inhibitor [archaeon]